MLNDEIGFDKMTNVCLYLRVSTSQQTTENQEMELLQLCERRGFNIVETYRETISGTKKNEDRKSETTVTEGSETDSDSD